jgi:hypothetical protein
MKDLLILNGRRYRLIPIQAEWEITLVQNVCACGHNGQTLPKGAKILEVKLGNETFAIGDRILEGKISEFVFANNYVQARLEDLESLVDSDHVHQFPTDGSPCVLCGKTIAGLFAEDDKEKPGYPSRENARLP